MPHNNQTSNENKTAGYAIAGYLLAFTLASQLSNKGLITETELRLMMKQATDGIRALGFPPSVEQEAVTNLQQVFAAAKIGGC
jgi:hypothetical protein